MRVLERLYDAPDTHMIAYNGGLVLRPDGSASQDVALQQNDALRLFDFCRVINLHASAFAYDSWYAWDDDHWSRREANNTGVEPNALSTYEYFAQEVDHGARPHKMMCMGAAGLVDQATALVAKIPGLVSYRSKDTYLEVANVNCSKGEGIKSVAQELDVPLAEVVYFGDNYNDLSAFQVVGTSVAVANARDQVLRAATSRTTRNDDDGVAEFLETWKDS